MNWHQGTGQKTGQERVTVSDSKLVRQTMTETAAERQQRRHFAKIWRDHRRTGPNSADRVRLRLYAPHLSGRVLDIGAGDGMLARLLHDHCSVVSCDVTVEALRELGGGVVAASAMHLPFKERSFGCIVATEVLEHIENDDRAISEMHRVLCDSGKLIVSVPLLPVAFPEALWILLTKRCVPLAETLDQWDPLHRRRYRRTALLRTLEKAGYSVISMHDTAGQAFTVGHYFVERILNRLGIRSAVATRMARLDRLIPVGPSSNVLVIAVKRQSPHYVHS